MVIVFSKSKIDTSNINVIVVPHGIINQWEDIFKRKNKIKIYELIKSNKKVSEFCVNVDKFILEEVGEEEFDFDSFTHFFHTI